MAKRRRRRAPRRFFPRAVLLLLLAAVFLWTQQNLIQTEVIPVSAENLPDGFDGMRIVIVSDLHGKEFGEDSGGLLKAVRKLDPDLIAVTGDLIEQSDQIAMVPALARGLSAIAPTYYVTGNHEWAIRIVPDLLTVLKANGVIPLSNETVTLERDGQRIFLMGSDDPNGPADQKSITEMMCELRRTQGDGFVLLLAHRNNKADDYAAAGIDLTLAGHAHGGLIRLPFTDGLIGPNREWLPTYTAGLYQLRYGQMVVSRGLGNVGRTLRLFNRPDLPLVVLHTAG